jgi:hypothetical protein
MRSFWKKHRLKIDIIGCILFAVCSIMLFIKFFGPERKGMDMITGIIFGLMSIIKAAEVIEQIRQAKRNGNIENTTRDV